MKREVPPYVTVITVWAADGGRLRRLRSEMNFCQVVLEADGVSMLMDGSVQCIDGKFLRNGHHHRLSLETKSDACGMDSGLGLGVDLLRCCCG